MVIENNIPAGAENHPNAPWNDTEEFECKECGEPMSEDSGYCSNSCWKASLL